MAEFRRVQVATLIRRLSEPPDWLVAIFGPRQTGKTTVARQALAAIGRPCRYEAVDEPVSLVAPGPVTVGADHTVSSSARRDTGWLAEVWERSRHDAWTSQRGFILVLDEIQKIDGWSDAVKGLWDADRASGCPLHVVVLGSAPLLMQAGLSESLAGRFEPLHLTHWSYPEMSEAFGFDLAQYVFFGGYPGAAPLVHDADRWVAYVRDALVAPNIERDVLAMTRVDKPALLRRLFDLGSMYSGQELSFNKMLGQLQDAGNTTTLARYLDLLSQAGLVTGLSKHTGRPVSAKASTPKLNVLNTALMAVSSGYTYAEARSDRSFWGRMVESSVGAHLVNTASPSTAVKYWRHGNHEVDFVLHRGPSVVGIEVKSGDRMAGRSGLTEFERRFRPRSTFVVGEPGVPLHEFLSVPADHWFGAP
ncbi:MAG: AAA family ATPase [bacterium]|nr:AAA family ATPase [bacterium]